MTKSKNNMANTPISFYSSSLQQTVIFMPNQKQDWCKKLQKIRLKKKTNQRQKLTQHSEFIDHIKKDRSSLVPQNTLNVDTIM
jgi:phage-related protein